MIELSLIGCQLKIEASTNISDTATSSARDYQIEAVQKLWQALHDKNVPVCLVLPTGGGKTRVANDIVIKWMDHHGA